MHGRKSYAAHFDIGGDRIDDGVGTNEGGRDATLIAHVGAEDVNPLRPSCAQGAARPIRMPDRDAHSRSLGGEAAHQTLAKEPRATEHGDRGHDIPSRMLATFFIAKLSP